MTLRAPEMAVKRRCPDPWLLHHSDQGGTYASEDSWMRLAYSVRLSSSEALLTQHN